MVVCAGFLVACNSRNELNLKGSKPNVVIIYTDI
jgi:hypothetical protein